jgi:hypothetical protein
MPEPPEGEAVGETPRDTAPSAAEQDPPAQTVAAPPSVPPPPPGDALVRDAIRTALGDVSEISESAIVLSEVDGPSTIIAKDAGLGELTLPARSPFVPDDEPAAPAAEAPASDAGGDSGGFARIETSDVMTVDDSAPGIATESMLDSSPGFAALESAEVPTSLRPVPSDGEAPPPPTATTTQEPSSETLLDDALIIEATSTPPRPSADTTGELDTADVLEAVELVEAEMPKPPPPPPPPPKAAAAKGKGKAPPPPPSTGGGKGKPPPPPVPGGRGRAR